MWSLNIKLYGPTLREFGRIFLCVLAVIAKRVKSEFLLCSSLLLNIFNKSSKAKNLALLIKQHEDPGESPPVKEPVHNGTKFLRTNILGL